MARARVGTALRLLQGDCPITCGSRMLPSGLQLLSTSTLVQFTLLGPPWSWTPDYRQSLSRLPFPASLAVV